MSSAIPGPRGIPLLGSAPAFLRDPLGFLSATAAEFGPVAELRLGPRRLVLVSRAEEIEDVLVRKADAFAKSALLRNAGGNVLGRALDTLDGAEWSERIQKVAPAFRREHAERATASAFELASEWARGAALGVARRVDHDFLALCIRVELHALLGASASHDETLALGLALQRGLDGWNAEVSALAPAWLPTPARRRARRAMERVRGWVQRAIAARPACRAPELPVDVLRRAGLDERTLCDELTVLAILGGHQLSLALTWTVYELAGHREICSHRSAQHDPEHLARAVDESLRLHPPFFLLVRDPVREVEIGGHPLRPGLTVALSPWVTQRSERYWTAPEAFRPERWTNGETNALPQFAYFPFGGGRRACIAKSMARGQLVAMLRGLLRHARFELVPEARPVARPAITLRVRGPLEMVVRAPDDWHQPHARRRPFPSPPRDAKMSQAWADDPQR